MRFWVQTFYINFPHHFVRFAIFRISLPFFLLIFWWLFAFLKLRFMVVNIIKAFSVDIFSIGRFDVRLESETIERRTPLVVNEGRSSADWKAQKWYDVWPTRREICWKIVMISESLETAHKFCYQICTTQLPSIWYPMLRIASLQELLHPQKYCPKWNRNAN